MLRPRAAFYAAFAAALLSPAPVFAQTQPPTPPAAQPSPPLPQNADNFGEEVMLTERTIVYMKGTATWDSAFETLVDAFKSLAAALDKQGLKPSGPAMTIYTGVEDTGFQFQAAV